MNGDSYIHGTSAAEKQRLALMNDLINAACLRELRLGSESLVLDMGCGQGQLTRLMAAALPSSSRVVGIERDPQQLEEAKALARAAGNGGRVDFRLGEVTTPPLEPEERGRFDLVHARFLLEHHAEPAAVVRSMVDAVRPGGRIVLLDDDDDLLRLRPNAPAVRVAWRAYTRLYERLGNDPCVGRRLVALLHEAGARPLRNTYIFYGACATEAHFDGIVENLHGVLAEMRAWKDLSASAVWYAINWAEGVRPEQA